MIDFNQVVAIKFRQPVNIFMNTFFNKSSVLLLSMNAALNCTLFVVLCFAGQALAGQVFYVYKDKSGRTYIEDSIPGELTKYGYKIINDRGIIIKEVPSVATKVKNANAQQRRAEKQRIKDIQKRKDQQLLRRFTSLEDIRETGNKKILALQSQIDITINHIKAFEKNLNDMEAHAALLRKKQESVSTGEVGDIKQMKENIEKNKKYITQRRFEQHRIRDEFIVLIREYKRLIEKNK